MSASWSPIAPPTSTTASTRDLLASIASRQLQFTSRRESVLRCGPVSLLVLEWRAPASVSGDMYPGRLRYGLLAPADFGAALRCVRAALTFRTHLHALGLHEAPAGGRECV